VGDYLLGIDIGTSGAKAVLCDIRGHVAAISVRDYPLYTPKAGWAEQDPEDWWRATVAAVRDVMDKGQVPPDRVHAVGLSGQQHGSVFLDGSHRVLRRALLWCDQRTAPQCDWIHEMVGLDTVLAETLNPVVTQFQAPKIVWLQQSEPELFERVRMILLPKDYIRFRLTGVFATEVSDASGTSLLNLAERNWSRVMLSALGLTADMLPEVHESPVASSAICGSAARETGLSVATPVAGGAGDNAASAVGCGIVEDGAVAVSVGTSGTVSASMGRPAFDPEHRVDTCCHAVPGQWLAMGVMLSAGGALRWFRDALCEAESEEARSRGIDTYQVIAERAALAPAGSEGLLFLPYLSGERTPYTDPDARGCLVGLELRHTKSHMARAIMEGVSYGLRDAVEVIHEMGLPIRELRGTGGGFRGGFWGQIFSDVCRKPVWGIAVDEGAAFGAALLAGVAVGIWPDVESACAAAVKTVHLATPDPSSSRIYGRYYAVYRGLYGALREHFAGIAALRKGA